MNTETISGNSRRRECHEFTIQDHGKHRLFLTVAGGLLLKHDGMVRLTMSSPTWSERNMEEWHASADIYSKW